MDPTWAPWLGSAARSACIGPGWLSLVTALIATCALAVTVRLMDDFLDATLDTRVGLRTSAVQMREAALPYALATFACGAALSPQLAVSLFAAAYCVGMTGDFRRGLPSGFAGWQEALVAFGVGTLAAGLVCMIWATILMITVQAYDDLQDFDYDTRAGCRNFCHRFGVGEVAIAAACGLVICFAFSPVLTFFGLAMVIFTGVVMPRTDFSRWLTHDD